MSEAWSGKRESEGQLSLYRLMRLQNRENNFLYRDDANQNCSLPSKTAIFESSPLLPPIPRAYFRVTYQHYPLETIPQSQLLRTFWKIITTHYFKPIDPEEKHRLQYLHHLFPNPDPPLPPPDALLAASPSRALPFWQQLTQLLHPDYVEDLTAKRLSPADRLWLKKMLLLWAGQPAYPGKKKMISKGGRGKGRKNTTCANNTTSLKNEWKREEARMDEELGQLPAHPPQPSPATPTDNIDEEIERLERELRANEQTNSTIIRELERRMEAEEGAGGTGDAASVGWLLHVLEEKQVAESVSKIVNCERSAGEPKFLVQFEQAMHLQPQLLSESQLRRLNQLRETSLLKFYRTGAKSLQSFTCQNYLGFTDLQLNRMTLHRVRDRDYLQAMKRAPVSAETREALEEQDVCHHCKFLFPPHMLSSCRFVSDRQAMPRSCEGELDLGQELGLQKGRASQRFVAKHRNSLTGYARVNEEYVCGRKYCSGCLKDNYGKDWMKANNGLCPFCLALCSCTRCLRNEKISKLKAFFLAQGGDLAALHLLSPLDHLPTRREDPLRPKYKPRRPAAKWKRIAKEKGERGRGRGRGSASKENLEEETERWESTAEKEVAWAGRRGARRGGERTY